MTGIIDYGAGNLTSLRLALEAIGAEHVLVRSAEELEACRRAILPGVGHAAQAMKSLETSGMADALRTFERPLLGICLGMQLLCAHSEEGDTRLLGLIPLPVKRFIVNDLKVPHVGWNTTHWQFSHPLMHGLPEDTWFYFVHSFAALADKPWCLGQTEYGSPFASVIQSGQRMGVQFHPEKSSTAGLALLKNFQNFA
jgi:imidazole glycerol-phosphate synthase subunit HisH